MVWDGDSYFAVHLCLVGYMVYIMFSYLVLASNPSALIQRENNLQPTMFPAVWPKSMGSFDFVGSNQFASSDRTFLKSVQPQWFVAKYTIAIRDCN